MAYAPTTIIITFLNTISRFRDKYFSKIFASIVEEKIEENGFILEAGCGSGKILEKISKNVVKVGCDISKEALKLAKNNCDYVIRSDIKQLPFKDNVFEIVFNQGVMEHFSDEEFDLILKELKRVSKKVIIIVPSHTSLFRLYNPFPEGKFFSKKELKDKLDKNFKKVDIKYLPKTFFLSIVAFCED